MKCYGVSRANLISKTSCIGKYLDLYIYFIVDSYQFSGPTIVYDKSH